MVEIATGMNYWDGTNWTESVPSFRPDNLQNGFVADQVQHRARVSANINQQGAIGLSTHDGQLLSSAPVGIALYDAASGQSLLIATVTNTDGVLVNSNQVYFQNAFSGGACASILYTLERNSFAQDVIFSGYLDPQAYGFPTNTTRIEILTEFFQPPTPEVLSQPMYVETNSILRQAMASPDLMDETLTFGNLVLGVGQAYTVPSLLEPAGAEALVGKQFTQTADGRYFLVESVPYSLLQNGFYSLPDCAPSGAPQGAIRHSSMKGMLAALPSAPNALKTKLAAQLPSRQLARGVLPKQKSVVVDYRATLTSGTTLIQGDTTYLVSGNISGVSLKLEGGAVLKYKPNVALTVNSVTMKNTGLYRPVVFTGVDDDTVGESMNGYTGSGYTGTINSSGYANPALGLGQLTLTASNCVFRYAQKAIQYAATSSSAATITLTHAQLYKCIRGIDLTWVGCGCGSGGTITVKLSNVLVAGVLDPINYAGLSATVSPSLINCTIDQADKLVGGSGTLSYSAVNSVFANITNSTAGTFSGNNNGFYSSAQSFGTAKTTVSASPFQSAGAGNYYLTDASGFRNAGTSSGLSGSLITDLGVRTTYPPVIVAATTIGTPQTYFAQAQRDTDTLDLGYHYDPLDWELGGVLVTNAAITVNAGAAIGVFGTNTTTYGLAIGQAAALQCQGAPNNRNWIAQFNTVQEQPYTNWFQTSGGALSSEFQGLSPGSSIYCRLTSWSTLGMAVPNFYGPTNTGPLNFQDCEFHGGTFVSTRPTVNLTNCLLERVYADLEPKDGLTASFRVGLVYGGSFIYAPSNSVVQDVLFDSTAITNWNGYSGGFNGYVTNSSQRLQPTQATDIIVGSEPSYQLGPLGNYYQLTNAVIINADTNTTANQVGLFHYTVTTNLVSGYEIKETNSLVDVSYHYVATDANGNPIDTNGDGIPDYLSDTNGNGLVDSGEIGWNVSGDLGLNVIITRPDPRSNVP